MNYELRTTNRVIGVVGPIASGKGVLIEFLQKQGYNVLSLSDVVRQKTKEQGLKITRKNLQDVGDSLRKKSGNAVLAEMIAPQIQKHPQGKFVIDAIRNPAEVEYLKNQFGAFIIGVTARAKIRFERMRQRGNSYDPTTWEEFEKIEQRDRGVGQETFGQHVDACLRLADSMIENSGNKEDFQDKIASIFGSF